MRKLHQPLQKPYRTRQAAALTICLFVLTVLLATTAAQAQTFNLVYTFDGVVGAQPAGSLLIDGLGNLYGATIKGGASLNGSVFKVSPSGTATRLYSFTGGTDGAAPEAGVISDANGNLYGTAGGGGYTGGICGAPRLGCGVVYKLSKSGKETVLYAFRGGSDGNAPYQALSRDAAGNLYGTTVWGGRLNTGACGTLGCGVVFKLDATGKETVLHAFTGKSDGHTPNSTLILDASGNIYGTTSGGGDFSGSLCQQYKGCGLIYKLDRTGNETVLYAFTGGADGFFPVNLIADPNGNFYGCTEFGGASQLGTIFELSAAGQFSVLYSFTNQGAANFCNGLVRDSAGNLYLTTGSGNGGVFELDAGGNFTMLHTFNTKADGSQPSGAPVLDAHGNLFGATGSGGNPQCGLCGVIYKVTP